MRSSSFCSVHSRPRARPGAVHLADRSRVFFHPRAHVPRGHPPGRVLGTRRRGRQRVRPRKRMRRQRLLRDRRGRRSARKPRRTAAAAAGQQLLPAQEDVPLGRGQGRDDRDRSAGRAGVRHVRLAGGHRGVLRGRWRRARRRERHSGHRRRRRRRGHNHHWPGPRVGVFGGHGAVRVTARPEYVVSWRVRFYRLLATLTPNTSHPFEPFCGNNHRY